MRYRYFFAAFYGIAAIILIILAVFKITTDVNWIKQAFIAAVVLAVFIEFFAYVAYLADKDENKAKENN